MLLDHFHLDPSVARSARIVCPQCGKHLGDQPSPAREGRIRSQWSPQGKGKSTTKVHHHPLDRRHAELNHRGYPLGTIHIAPAVGLGAVISQKLTDPVETDDQGLSLAEAADVIQIEAHCSRH